MLDSKFEAVLAIEICPWHLSDRPAPKVVRRGPAAEAIWENYRVECCRDAGVPGLVPVAETSFYRVSAIPDSLLRMLVVNELSDIEPQAPVDEQVVSFYGGIVLLLDGLVAHYPGCCCTLDDASAWFRGFAEWGTAWSSVWVGHDVDKVELRRVTSQQVEIRIGPFLEDAWDRNVRVSASRFALALSDALAQRTKLAKRIESLGVSLPVGYVIADVAKNLAGISMGGGWAD